MKLYKISCGMILAAALTATSRADDDQRTMRVRVVDEAQRPVPHASVHASIWSPDPVKANRTYTADADGKVTVELPKRIRILRVWARQTNFVPLFAQWWPEKQADGHLIPPEFVFVLPRGTDIGGVIRNDMGQPISGATVEVMRVTPDLAMRQRPVLGTWLAEGEDAIQTDEKGRWSLGNVPEGDSERVRIKLSHPNYINDTTWGGLQGDQQVTMEQLRKKESVIVMPSGIRLTGQVTTPEGDAVADALVVFDEDPYLTTGSQEVRTDANGIYRLPPQTPGTKWITVVAKGWSPTMTGVEISAEANRRDFQLAKGVTTTIEFVEPNGLPISEVGVMISEWGGKKSLYNYKHPNVLDSRIPRKSDDKGRYVWNWAPDSPVTYSFFKQGYRDRRGVQIKPGQRTITLVPELRIVGKVTDAKTGKPIKSFRVLLSFGVTAAGLRSGGPPLHFHDGKYQFVNEQSHRFVVVRIEADGYESVVSPPFVNESGIRLFNAKLERSK